MSNEQLPLIAGIAFLLLMAAMFVPMFFIDWRIRHPRKVISTAATVLSGKQVKK